ncbi:hypothetical protein [Mesorhizobium sp. M1322]
MYEKFYVGAGNRIARQRAELRTRRRSPVPYKIFSYPKPKEPFSS